MEEVMQQFRNNMERVRNLGVLGTSLSAQTTRALDLSDLLRAELVLAVSAFDHFVHEITRVGMLQTYSGQRPRAPGFMRFQMSMENVLKGIDNSADSHWLDQEIRNRHGHQSFQHPDNIANAVRLISEVQLWNEVALKVGSDSDSVKNRLRLIVLRRNQIAHEADINPSYPDMRWPIDYQDVGDSMEFLNQIAEAIYQLVHNQN